MRWIRRIGITLVVGIVLLAGGGWWLWDRATTAPTWLAPLEAPDPGAAALAETVEYRLVEEFQRLRPADEPWTLRIRENQLNAWFAERLPEWIAYREDSEWPSELGPPRLRFTQDGIDLAVRVGGAGPATDRAQVVVARLEPRIVDGRLRLDVSRLGLGQLALPGGPASALFGTLDRIAPAGALDEVVGGEMLAVFTDASGMDSFFELADGRRVELMDVRLVPGAIEITSRTALPGATQLEHAPAVLAVEESEAPKDEPAPATSEAEETQNEPTTPAARPGT